MLREYSPKYNPLFQSDRREHFCSHLGKCCAEMVVVAKYGVTADKSLGATFRCA